MGPPAPRLRPDTKASSGPPLNVLSEPEVVRKSLEFVTPPTMAAPPIVARLVPTSLAEPPNSTEVPIFDPVGVIVETNASRPPAQQVRSLPSMLTGKSGEPAPPVTTRLPFGATRIPRPKSSNPPPRNPENEIDPAVPSPATNPSRTQLKLQTRAPTCIHGGVTDTTRS